MNTVAASTPTALRVRSDISDRYISLAERTGRSKSFYMNEALEGSIDYLEYVYDLMKKVEDYHAGRLETVTLDELEKNLGLAD